MCVCSCATPIDPIEMRAFDPPVVRVRPSVVGEAATLTDDPISSETLVATMPLFLAVLSVPTTHYHYPDKLVFVFFVLSRARKPIGFDFHGRRSSNASTENACA